MKHSVREATVPVSEGAVPVHIQGPDDATHVPSLLVVPSIYGPTEDVTKIMRVISKYHEDELQMEDVFRIIRATMSLGGQVTGLPGKYAADVGKGVADAAMGEVEKGMTEVLGWSPYLAEQVTDDSD